MTVLRIIAVAKSRNESVSNVLGVQEEYTAYCLDEACNFIYNQYSEMEEKDRRKIKWKDNNSISTKPKNNASLFEALE